jgi:hypothetical protein
VSGVSGVLAAATAPAASPASAPTTFTLSGAVLFTVSAETTTAASTAAPTATAAVSVATTGGTALILLGVEFLALRVRNDGSVKVKVVTQVLYPLIVEEPVEVAPGELLLDQAAALEGLHQLHHVEVGGVELLAPQLAGPGAQAVLLANEHTLREEVAVYVVTGLLGDVRRHCDKLQRKNKNITQ